jgi:acetylornithine/succinyldiaminopimelate/putrescine aminotransferase
MGLMLAIDLDSAETAKAVVAQLLERGILINRTHETVLRFLPPYIIEKKHVDEVISALDRALQTSEHPNHREHREHRGRPQRKPQRRRQRRPQSKGASH